MKIVFIGAVEFSARALEHLLAMGADIVGVCTLAASPGNADFRDLGPIAAAHGVPSQYVTDINAPETIACIRAWSPQVIFCFGWSRLLRKPLLEAAPLGVVGYHPAALPMNRGRHPVIWSLALGLSTGGSTFFLMGEGADDGDIISQRLFPIDESDDASTVYARMVEVALSQIGEFVPALAAGTLERWPQEHARANTWRKRGRADGQIDWRMSACGVRNLVRALTRPYVGAHFVHHGEDVKVWKAAVVVDVPGHLEPGKVVAVTPAGPVVKCGEHAIRLLETSPTIVLGVGDYL